MQSRLNKKPKHKEQVARLVFFRGSIPRLVMTSNILERGGFIAENDFKIC